MVILIIIAFLVMKSIGFFGAENTKSGDEEDRQMTKQELVDYFVDETTTYPGVNQPMKSMAWDNRTVTASIEDQPPAGGEKALDDFISVFNNNSTTTKLEKVDSGGDIKIYFQASTGEAAGKSGPSSGDDFIIDRANVKISENAAVFEQSLSSVLSHEMFHALGFTGHYSGSTCRLMSSRTCGAHLTQNEERLIQMLYSSGLPVGSDEETIRAHFQNWTPK